MGATLALHDTMALKECQSTIVPETGARRRRGGASRRRGAQDGRERRSAERPKRRKRVGSVPAAAVWRPRRARIR
jgi:hypothetical protein